MKRTKIISLAISLVLILSTAVPVLAGEAATHFDVNFETGYAAGDKVASGSSGTLGDFTVARSTNASGSVKIVDDPTASSKGKVVEFSSAADNYWASAKGSLSIKNTNDFATKVTGTQIAEVEMYIPSTVTVKGSSVVNGDGDEITINFNAISESTCKSYLKLGMSDSYTAGQVSTLGNKIKAIKDRWFKVRYVHKYGDPRKAELQVVDNGKVTRIQGLNGSSTAEMKNNGLGNIFITHDNTAANIRFYIGEIKYYQADNMPLLVDFEKYTNTNISGIDGYNSNYDVDYLVSTAGSPVIGVQADPENSENHVLAINTNANNENCTIKTHALPVNNKSGIITMETDIYLPETLTASADRIEIRVFGTSALEGFVRIGANGSLAGNNNDVVYSGTYPVNQWFTIRFSYDTINHAYKYEMIKKNGVTTLLGRSVATDTEKADVVANGLLALQIYQLGYGDAADLDAYYDNIQIGNINPESISVVEEGSDYKATLSHTLKGDIQVGTRFIIAQYDSTGKMVSAKHVAPVFSNSGSYDVVVPKDSTASSVRVFFWDDVMRPILTQN